MGGVASQRLQTAHPEQHLPPKITSAHSQRAKAASTDRPCAQVPPSNPSKSFLEFT